MTFLFSVGKISIFFIRLYTNVWEGFEKVIVQGNENLKKSENAHFIFSSGGVGSHWGFPRNNK